MADLRILNLGAGVQSTTVYLMACRGEIEPYDYAIFADTQEEPGAVYQHLEWLQREGSIPILIRTAGKLGDDLIHGRNTTGGRFSSIPAYVSGPSSASPGKGRRQCTREYKIDVIERCIRRELLGLAPRQRIPKGTTVTQAYGISMDEAGRSRRIMERVKRHSPWIRPEFPLLARFMTRADCARWLKSYGVPHQVPKSACVFCPYHSNAQWIWLRDNDPAGWKRAVEVDRALRAGAVASRGIRGSQYLHRSCRPLEEAVLDLSSAGWQFSFEIECAGMCGV